MKMYAQIHEKEQYKQIFTITLNIGKHCAYVLCYYNLYKMMIQKTHTYCDYYNCFSPLYWRNYIFAEMKFSNKFSLTKFLAK